MAQAKPLEVVTRDEIRSLLRDRRGPALSLFHPTERVAVEAEQNSLHLKNLIGQAHDELERRGLRRPEIEELLEPLNSLLGNTVFWHHQLDGLAILRSPDVFRYYRLPYHVQELVVVGDRFHVRPLLRAVAERHYYILALSQNSVRLLRATRYGIEEVDLEGTGIPRSLAEALQYDDMQKPELQVHPVMGTGRSDAGPAAPTQAGGKRDLPGRKHAYHGHGESGEGDKTQLQRFFTGIDAGMSKILGSEHAPLILAGVEYERGYYRDVNHYHFLLDEGIEGSPERASKEQLHEQSLRIVEPLFRKELDQAKEQFGAQLPAGSAASTLPDALRAARDGRIRWLFLPEGEQRWGTFDIAQDSIIEHDQAQPGDVDLLDQLSAMTLEQSGEVFVVDRSEIPGDGLVAAVYRY